MILEINNQLQPTKTHLDIPSVGNIPTPQVEHQRTPYDYFALIPALIIAATPLILGLKNNKNKGKNS